jgi:dTDP-4-amino-4,6-dideoxygalactose transaminase
MEVNFNTLTRGYLKHKKEYDSAALEVLESGWYILGKYGEKFEKEFSEFLGANYCLGLNSGLDSLTLALRALNIGVGDEVIVPANTYIASVLSITENKASPVFVEPDEFYNLDPRKIEEKITDKTKAIIVVHLYGQAANIEKIYEISKKYNLYLIEDCAQSHGAMFNNKVTGTWGDIGCFSFYPTKNIGAFGDSGAIITDDKVIYERIKMLRNYGSKEKYKNEVVGINSRMDEIQAALLSVRLSHYNEFLLERKSIAKRYLEGINNTKIDLPKIQIGSDHVWHLFVIKTEKRETLRRYLLNHGISTQIHYPIPPHLSKAYCNLGYKKGDFPLTEKYSDEILSLPLFEGMNNEEVEYVINVVNSY